jgi:hypothetical protein
MPPQPPARVRRDLEGLGHLRDMSWGSAQTCGCGYVNFGRSVHPLSTQCGNRVAKDGFAPPVNLLRPTIEWIVQLKSHIGSFQRCFRGSRRRLDTASRPLAHYGRGGDLRSKSAILDTTELTLGRLVG